MEQQTQLIRRYLKRRTQSPPSPTEQALNQLVKGCKMAMHNAALLAEQNEQLFAENHRQKRKRAQPRTYIARGGVLNVAETQQRLENERNVALERAEAIRNKPQRRAPPRCSICASLEHTARTCFERQSIVV